MRYPVYNVRYSIAPINLSPLTITFYSSVIKTLVYKDTRLLSDPEPYKGGSALEEEDDTKY
jgi:hypothetical protein